MKTIVQLLGSAVFGSMITLGVYHWADFNEPVRVEHVYSNNDNIVRSVFDQTNQLLSFNEVSSKVMPTVVHIKSTYTKQVNTVHRDEIPEPFKFFFDDDFFSDRFRMEEKIIPKDRIGTGSGVIINPNGYIITNNHVINDASAIEVTLNDKETYNAEVIGTDPSTDLALLKIDASNLPYIALGNSDNVQVGDWVLAVGNPYNLNSTVTAGIVSAKARNINLLKEKAAIESFIQTDAAINPGNSGGALVDLNGALIGINTAIASPTGSYSGYGFAVPANIVSKVVDDFIEYGAVQRAYLGVMIKDVTTDLARTEDLDVSGGVYVDSLMPEGAAKAGGIKEGDVILEFDDKIINSVPELLEAVGIRRPGDQVKVKVNRHGKIIEKEVQLKNKKGKTDIVKSEHSYMLSKLGLELEIADKKTLKKLGISSGLRVKSINPGKIKRNTDMREGFIITKVGDRTVSTIEEFVNAVQSHEDEGVLIEGYYESTKSKQYYAFGM